MTMLDNDVFLPFARPSVSDAAIDEVVDSLRSGWITTGPKVKKFETALGEYLGAPYVVAVSSATAGLHLAMMTLDLQPGDEVITTSMTFAATLNSIINAGGTPVLVDVDPTTYNMDISRVGEVITERTQAIVPVHFAGLPVDLDPLYELADRHDLRVIEDAAHAIGTGYKGKRIGSFGDIQVFSFHPNKNMTTGEGGCVVTRDSTTAKQISVMRFHGIDREAWERFGKKGDIHYDVVSPGYKYNMMDIQAALGLHQLQALDGFIDRRAELVGRYIDELADWLEWTLPSSGGDQHRHTWCIFAPTINPDQARMDRDEFMRRMKENNIGTGLHYQAPHLFTYYRDRFGFKEGDYPNAERISDRIVSLPLFPDMTDDDQGRVCGVMARVFGR